MELLFYSSLSMPLSWEDEADKQNKFQKILKSRNVKKMTLKDKQRVKQYVFLVIINKIIWRILLFF